jgi:hypothetical protein
MTHYNQTNELIIWFLNYNYYNLTGQFEFVVLGCFCGARGCTTAGGAAVLLVFSLVVDPVLTWWRRGRVPASR